MNTNQKWLLAGGLILLVLIFGFGFFYSTNQSRNTNRNLQVNSYSNQGQNNSVTKKNCVAEECLQVSDLNYPAGTLTNEAKTALTSAINDEYKARAVYQAVIDKFGSVRPFIMIIRAEEQHISSLKALFDKYGLPIPTDNTKDFPSLTSVAGACKIGVDAEIANANLYKNELLPQVTQYEDITAVFTQLKNASEQNHLPAFQRCAN